VPRPAAPDPLRTPVVDTHCHLDVHDRHLEGEALSPEDAVLMAARAGVSRIVQIGCDLRSAEWSVEFAERMPQVWAGIGIHPNDAARLVERDGDAALDSALTRIRELAVSPAVRAIGETGLDHYRTGEGGRPAQERSFRSHIEMAKDLDRALVIHDRDAHDDVIRTLEESGPPDRVIFHCFSGDERMARYCTNRGWYLSFAGVVTFKNADGLREALAAAPLDRVLVETDAPYLTPVPHRGAANASYLVPLTVREMARVRGLDEDTMAAALWENSERVFGPL
jgi:TatD DNase family protein